MSRRPTKIREVLPGFWQTLRYFWPYMRTERLLVGGSFAAIFCGIVMRLLEPWPLKFVLDQLIGEPVQKGLPKLPWIDISEPLVLVTLAASAVVLIAAFRAAADYSSRVGFFLIGNRAIIRVRDDVFRHLQGLSLSYHRKAKAGDLIIRVTRDVSLLRDVLSTAVLPLLVNVLMILGMVTVMFWIHWQLALLAMATVPLFWFTTLRIGRRIREAARKQRKREGAMASFAAESIGAIDIVQALSLEGVFAETFTRRNQASQKEDFKANRLSARLGRTIDVLLAIATATILWFGARLVLNSQLSPTVLLVFLVYVKRAFKPAQDFAKYTARLAKATAAGERVMELLETRSDIDDLPHAIEAPPFRGHVRFAGVSFGYEPGHDVLRGVDFEVRPGQRVALVGPSGIGKSTLINLILRLYDPVQGSVMIDGRDIREYTIRSLRSQVGVVLQDTVLFAATVRENIAYGARDASEAQVREAARLASADAFICRLPQGYETIVGERGLTLSKGQRQRIAVARATIRRSPILILDEPTSGLDEENEQAVIQSLKQLAQGRTTFLITHNLQLASDVDMIVYLDEGCLVERGSHDELMRFNGQYAKLFQMQTRA